MTFRLILRRNKGRRREAFHCQARKYGFPQPLPVRNILYRMVFLSFYFHSQWKLDFLYCIRGRNEDSLVMVLEPWNYWRGGSSRIKPILHIGTAGLPENTYSTSLQERIFRNHFRQFVKALSGEQTFTQWGNNADDLWVAQKHERQYINNQ